MPTVNAERIHRLRDRAAQEPHNREAIADELVRLAHRMAEQDHPDEAIPAVEQALAIAETLALDDSAYGLAVGDLLDDLGSLWRQVGDHDKALASSRRAVSVLEALDAPNAQARDLLATALINRSVDLRDAQLTEQAAQDLTRAVAIYEALSAEDESYRADLADALVRRARALRRADRPTEALPLAQRAVGLYALSSNDDRKARDAAFAERGCPLPSSSAHQDP